MGFNKMDGAGSTVEPPDNSGDGGVVGGLIGAAGAPGAAGATGPAGPNVVDGTTTTTLTGILYGNGATIAAAVAGNFPTLNQSTSGNAATATTAAACSGNAATATTLAGALSTALGGTGVTTGITAIPAANVTGSHTLPDGVLSTNVPLLNAANTFTANQTLNMTATPKIVLNTDNNVATPTTTEIGRVSFQAAYDSSHSTREIAYMRVITNVAQTGASGGSRLELAATAPGLTTPAIIATLDSSGLAPSSNLSYGLGKTGLSWATVYGGQFVSNPITLSTASSTIGAWALTAGSKATATLTSGVGPYTMPTPGNLNNGSRGVLFIIQPASGTPQTIGTWPTVFKFPGGTAPTLTATLGAVDIFEFVSDGTSLFLVNKSLDVR